MPLELLIEKCRDLPGHAPESEIPVLADGSDPVPDREAAVASLSALAANGKAVRVALGNDSLWTRR